MKSKVGRGNTPLLCCVNWCLSLCWVGICVAPKGDTIHQQHDKLKFAVFLFLFFLPIKQIHVTMNNSITRRRHETDAGLTMPRMPDRAVRCCLMALVAGILWPLTFGRFSKLGKKEQ